MNNKEIIKKYGNYHIKEIVLSKKKPNKIEIKENSKAIFKPLSFFPSKETGGFPSPQSRLPTGAIKFDSFSNFLFYKRNLIKFWLYPPDFSGGFILTKS
jgi:hypothetical protein